MNQVAGETSQTPLLVIRPSKGWSSINVKELIQYRDLLFVLANRDIKLRYRQTLLGPIWIVLQPLLGAGVMNFIFGSVARLPTPGKLPTFLICFTGQLGWTVFSGIVSKTSGSLIGNSHLVAKVYFPRLLLPLSTVFAVLVDFLAASLLVPVLMIMYHVMPGWPLLLLPVWIIVLALMGLGIGLCAAAIMVSYRDVSAVLNVIMGFLPYISGVGFVIAALPVKAQPIAIANPVASLIEAFRWSLLGSTDFHTIRVAYACAFAAAAFLAGVVAFKRMERRFADVI